MKHGRKLRLAFMCTNSSNYRVLQCCENKGGSLTKYNVFRKQFVVGFICLFTTQFILLKNETAVDKYFK